MAHATVDARDAAHAFALVDSHLKLRVVELQGIADALDHFEVPSAARQARDVADKLARLTSEALERARARREAVMG